MEWFLKQINYHCMNNIFIVVKQLQYGSKLMSQSRNSLVYMKENSLLQLPENQSDCLSPFVTEILVLIVVLTLFVCPKRHYLINVAAIRMRCDLQFCIFWFQQIADLQHNGWVKLTRISFIENWGIVLIQWIQLMEHHWMKWWDYQIMIRICCLFI